jgi:tRNA dimethylallyltransferase
VRISRALEVWEQTGVPISRLRREAAPRREDGAALAPHVIVLDPPLPALRARIEARTRGMLDGGFEDEVRALRAAGYGTAARPLPALGYAQVGALLDGACSRAEAEAAIGGATVAYARRQRTWFRKEAAAARLEAPPAAETLAGALEAELLAS